ncbi:MAG: methyltransferase domain-containing protein, partial [Acidimicrobiia bacterium]|nr:methyltransferase domain-containing protein [Acidimicrobiia bacterium]
MSAYGRFAVDYDLLFDDVELRLGTTTPGVRAVLSGLRAGSRVLDAACGIGLDATWLARRGIGVTAADASAAMVAATRARLDDVGCAAEVVECTWLDLPGRLPVGSFDVVLCVGNS